MAPSNVHDQMSTSHAAVAADSKEQQKQPSPASSSSSSVGIVSSSSPQQRSHHRMQLGDVTANNLGQLKQLNVVLFPVNYSQKFYDDVLQVGEFAKLAYFNDVCVGAVCCRKDPIPNMSPEQMRLYIMTLGVLAPYRHYGVGTLLLKHILYHAATAAQHGQRFVEAYLHVQTSNEEALAFYRKHGFDICETVENYYKRISPADAYVLRKKLT